MKDTFPCSCIIETSIRIGNIWNEKFAKVDCGKKAAYLREIDEFSGLGEFTGIIDRATYLFWNNMISEDDLCKVIGKWEELWYKILGHKNG